MALEPSVTIQSPENGAIVAPAARSIVVDIVTPGSNPAREFHITINSVNVLTVIAGSATFVGAAYICVISTPSASVERVTLTRTSNWPDPSDLDITAAYRAAPAGPIYAISNTCLVASYTFQAGSPYPGQPDVSRESSISLAITTTATVLSAELSIAGDSAVLFSAPGPAVWSMPDFVGRLVYAGGTLSIVADPRRVFDSEQVVDVELSAQLYAGGAVSVKNSFLYQFHVRSSTTNLVNPALRFTRLDRVFENAAASETLRYLLRGALLTRPLAPSFEIALYSQVMRSSLGSVALQFRRPDLDVEIERLVAEDIPDVLTVDAAVSEASLLWEAVLLEAAELNLSRDLLQLIAKTYDSPYPQERVGAACAMIFAQAPLRA
jgi:hypothetical protein